MDSTDELEYTYTLSELMKRNYDYENENECEDGGSIGAIENKEEWFKDKETYEMHFNQLQEQLVAAMVENQQLVEEAKKLDRHSLTELTQSLEEERLKRKKAESRVKILMSKRRRKNSGSSSTSFDHDFEDLTHEVGDEKNGFPENDSEANRKSKCRRKLLEYKIYFWNFFHERISDFINDDDILTEQVEEEELSVRRLKENVNRFTEAIQPIQSSYSSFDSLFAWKSPWLTLSIFTIYTYSFCLEMAVPLLLFLMLLQMSWNFMQARGIGKKFLNPKKKVSDEVPKDDQTYVSLSERYQLVLLIAKKVQNTLGNAADALEKIHNLLLWQHDRASKLLFQTLLAALAMSIILPANRFFMLSGILVGIKLFVITPIYIRFPKVQKRYDDFQLLWEELPTHKENLRRKIQETIEICDDHESSSPEPSCTSATSTSPCSPSTANDQQLENISHDTIVFCDRFQLPITEAPVHEWQEGRRCTMMDKESPLSSMRHGRMYLTASYLCFERNQFHSKKNVAISLTDIAYVRKAKPISFMPGSGMAIEVQVKNLSKPYLFGAMIGRDEAFDSIVKAGRLLNLSWSQQL